VAAAALLACLSAHAADPSADAKIAVAQASLQRAEQSGAPLLAPVDLATARDKLARAEKAKSNDDPKTATALAEQADIDAQVAEANAQSQHAHTAAAEFDASMQALRAEAMRATPTTP
jgi:uncharacterized protein YmfQ (DUF2313 family)